MKHMVFGAGMTLLTLFLGIPLYKLITVTAAAREGVEQIALLAVLLYVSAVWAVFYVLHDMLNKLEKED